MSIQIAKAQKIQNKILDKTRIGFAMDWLSVGIQKTVRHIKNAQPSVYYHYYGRYTHPHIRQRMYGKYAPVNWQNFESAQIAHFLQKPESTSKPYLIEPNDHILTIGTMFGTVKPSELIKRIPDILEIIASKNFKGFLLGPDGLADQFQYYFGSEYANKLMFYPQARSIPKIGFNSLGLADLKATNTAVKFICLAGNYQIKAVDILIDAWLSIAHLNDATLTIVCPNIPEPMLKRLAKIASIKIIPIAPLKDQLKARLLSQADVSIGLTHTDGGVNMIEGMEYGHAVITNTNHRSTYFAKIKNAHVINFPHEYYKNGSYGVIYDSVSEYLSLVGEAKRTGEYEDSKQELAKAVTSYIENPELLREHSRSSRTAIEEQSVWKSNAALLKIYRKSIES